jgi:hypothetical protein
MSGYYAEGLIKTVIEKPAFLYSGVRKIVQDITYRPHSLPLLTYQDLGYGSNKARQMERNYINLEELERVKAILTKRKDHQFTSVAMSMRGGKKDARSMGWCMLSLIVTCGPKLPTRVEVQYRSTELILKFGADWVFLPTVFDRLGIKPDSVTFRLANAYLSGVFFPTLCSFWEPVDFLDYLWKNDKKLFAGGTRFFLRSAYKEDQRFPYSPENQQHKFLWSRLGKNKIKFIRDYLHEKHKAIGKPLPRTHHPLEDDDE